MAKIHPKQREKVADLLRAGVPVIEAARRARMSITTARAIGHWLGLLAPRPKKAPKPPRPPRPPAQPKEPKAEGRRHGVAPWQYAVALAALRSGSTCRDAAEHAAIGDRTAAKIAREHGLRVRPRGAVKGEKGVPLALRAAALRLVAEGKTLREAGAAVGVSRQRMHQWARDAGVDTSKGRKRKTKAAVREQVKPAQLGAKVVQVRGVTLARVAVVERKPEMA